MTYPIFLKKVSLHFSSFLQGKHDNVIFARFECACAAPREPVIRIVNETPWSGLFDKDRADMFRASDASAQPKVFRAPTHAKPAASSSHTRSRRARAAGSVRSDTLVTSTAKLFEAFSCSPDDSACRRLELNSPTLVRCAPGDWVFFQLCLPKVSSALVALPSMIDE
jgi:hypothetical protein